MADFTAILAMTLQVEDDLLTPVGCRMVEADRVTRLQALSESLTPETAVAVLCTTPSGETIETIVNRYHTPSTSHSQQEQTSTHASFGPGMCCFECGPVESAHRSCHIASMNHSNLLCPSTALPVCPLCHTLPARFVAPLFLSVPRSLATKSS